MRSYTRAPVLALALGLLLGAAAGCVAVPTETPTPAATPPTAVAGAAGTPTVVPCTPCTPCATNTPLPTAPATAVPTAVAGVAATLAPTALPTATSAPPTAVPAATGVPPTAAATATGVPPAIARAATSTPSSAAPTATPAATRTAAPTATVAATQTLTATPACCVGQRCVVDGVALTVRNVTSGQPVSGIATPQPGQTLLVTDVTIENVGQQPVAYNPQVFRVRAADGAEYGARTILPDESGNPGPGEVVRLRVAFEVPQSASGFTLLYSPPSLGPQEVQVDLTCSRPP